MEDEVEGPFGLPLRTLSHTPMGRRIIGNGPFVFIHPDDGGTGSRDLDSIILLKDYSDRYSFAVITEQVIGHTSIALTPMEEVEKKELMYSQMHGLKGVYLRMMHKLDVYCIARSVKMVHSYLDSEGFQRDLTLKTLNYLKEKKGISIPEELRLRMENLQR